jgi:hypothetical protein
MKNKTILTDALVTADDVLSFKTAVDRGDFKRLVYELVTQEPEVAIALSQKFERVNTMLQGATMPIKQRAIVKKQLTLLVWMPVLLVSQAHRRSWNDFLPSEQVIDESADEGGAQ